MLPGSIDSGERLCWRFRHVDHGGRWCFEHVSPEQWQELMMKMAHCESMTVNELRRTWRLFKDYDLPGGLAQEALDRLAEL